MIKFSIIIPIYNAANTLHECILSIINQNYENIEIILVNDGSKDNSFDICCQWKEKDKRIIFKDKKNEGVARARNDGLLLATGDYVYFVDPDDKIKDNLFYNCSCIIDNFFPDVLVFGHQKVLNIDGKVYHKDVIPPSFIVDNDDQLKKQYLTKMFISGAGFSAWDKLIKRDFLLENKLSFPLLKRGQDMAFCANVFNKSKKIVCIENLYYEYLDFNSTGNSKQDPDILKNHEYIFRQFCNIFYKDIENFCNNVFLQNIYLKWFFYVVPNNVINGNIKIKKEIFSNLYYDDFSKVTLDCFKISDAVGFKNKFLLSIMKLKNSSIHSFFLTCIVILNLKLSNYRRK